MGASPMLLPALRGHALGRDILRAAGRNALPALMCALVYIYKRAAQKKATQVRAVGDVQTKCRRRGKGPTARRWRLASSR